jgi:dGTPase
VGWKYIDVTIAVVKELPTVRDRTEEFERASLSTWAMLATDTKGRDHHEEPDALRTVFQVDRDRILQSPEFRRLKDTTHGTPIPITPTSSLMHTLHVMGVARTIARALRLNEDLVEAITLGHDLGMPPFGAAGEESLSTFTQRPFRHPQQSLRVVETLASAGKGLNLTWEVRDGILHHDHVGEPATLEGQTVNVADRLAGVAHGIDEAVRAGILSASDLPAEVTAVLGATLQDHLSRLISDVVVSSTDRPDVQLSPRTEAALSTLERFYADRVERRRDALAERARALHCLRSIAVYYLEAPDLLPSLESKHESPVVQVCDFLCGLSDAGALDEFRRRFLPTAS